MEDSFHPRRTLGCRGPGNGLHGDSHVLLRFLERPEFREIARRVAQRAAVHLRLGADPARGAARAGGDPGPAGHQPLRDDRGPRHHEPAARWPVAAGLGRRAPWRDRGAGRQGRRYAPRPPGEVGSVQLRGPNLFREYWRRPEATREAFASGWFDTGDLGTRDENGFLTLVGRKNDLIITNGFNVYPQVVERVINECPGVRESAVLGVPDRQARRARGRGRRAERRGADRAARFAAYLRERLVDYQRPADIVFVSRACRATPWARCSAASCETSSPRMRAPRNQAPSPIRSIDRLTGDSLHPMIDLAWISLAALVLVIVLSCTTAVNPGFLSLALAWVIGIYVAPWLRADVHGRRGARRFSHRPVPDAGGGDAALHPGARQRHARPAWFARR